MVNPGETKDQAIRRSLGPDRDSSDPNLFLMVVDFSVSTTDKEHNIEDEKI